MLAEYVTFNATPSPIFMAISQPAGAMNMGLLFLGLLFLTEDY